MAKSPKRPAKRLDPELEKKLSAMPRRYAEPPKMAPLEDVMRRRANADALYRKLFTKSPAKAAEGGRGRG